MKAATPRNTRKGAHAERLVYGGLLAQLMRIHLAEGNADKRRVSLQALKAAGVQLDCLPQARGQRLDAQWAMRRWHEWRAANLSADPAECSQILKRCFPAVPRDDARRTNSPDRAAQDWPSE